MRFVVRSALSRVLLVGTLAALVTTSGGCFLPSSPDGDRPAPVAAELPTTGTQASWNVDVGPGHDTWVAVAENETVGKVSGAQGGHHVSTSLKVSPVLEATWMTIEIEVTTPTGEVISRSQSVVDAKRQPDGTLFEGLRAFVNGDTNGAIIVRAKVVDTAAHGSRWARGEKHVVVR